MVECESVFLWLEGIEFGLSRTPKFRGEELKRKDEPLQGREPSSLRREDPLQRSNRLCRAAGKANARVRKGSHCTRIVPKEEGGEEEAYLLVDAIVQKRLTQIRRTHLEVIVAVTKMLLNRC